ncbi:MAG: RNA polymerase sigma factor [Candidatus Kapabacteria bacterium]|nr:RNA polymerase sigma factor [Candidatus Kapabacteria bacterium]MCS7169834.1 RNA polymerase sigma factor [Candidatus Kapabacteria bacterium]MDW7996632.1 RNA polymerase sigma factor [Bacteroidota bacterium]MDW8225050.1 RNA polymerase sigma factor [Bacteroidota bacterium]
MAHLTALSIASDEELIREFCHGDRELAAAQFVRRYQRFVYSVAYRYLGRHEDAQDAAQEVFLKAFEHLHRFERRSTIRTWLYRITVRVALSMLRQRKRAQWLPWDEAFSGDEEPQATTLSPDQAHEREEFNRYFHTVLSNLPEKQRETFVLRYMEGLSYEEISQMLGTSIGGLKANYFLAVRKIANALLNGPYGEYFRQASQKPNGDDPHTIQP